ncbi:MULTISPECIES: hypothetical protein [Maribacter]|uniref:Uncharacterized protein n=1 Tax=Maribacter flavus TaxID=1658664 RepID=A0ABU7IDL2_9FLAO|nr:MULTISPECIES: hypothetical protein [Maribacter]MDC6403889.1 hypothetical protein [Maribacter sp. PR66]MEE1971030.1 hypothetical protein [Maribacter flavus]
MKMLFLGFLSLIAYSTSLDEVRSLYPKAKDDASITNTLAEKLSGISQDDAIELYGYKGAVLTLKAEHAKAVKDKKGFFKEGVSILEAAIASKPGNIELRFIRLSVQENAPKIVKYNDAIDADKDFILDHFSGIRDGSLKKMIRNYIQGSKVFTYEEKSAL